MIGVQFYHESVRTAVAVFGGLFNNIVIKRLDGKVVPVPIAYGPRVKWLDAQNQLNQSVELFENLLPRMSYEMTGMKYDTNRKLNNKQGVIGESALMDGRGPRINAPVPYNLYFTLHLQTKNLNDGWQIIEQILPFFQPAYTVRVRHFPDTTQFGGNPNIALSPLNEYDMPITLEDVSWEDNYDEGEIQDRRNVEWELKFNTKIHLWGPVTPATIIYDARVAIGVVGANENIETVNIGDLGSVSETGFYNQEPTWRFDDSDLNISTSKIQLVVGDNGNYIMPVNETVNAHVVDPRYIDSDYMGRYLVPSQDFVWFDTTQPIYQYLYTFTTFMQDGSVGLNPRVDQTYFVRLSNISNRADSEGFYTAEMLYLKRDPTILPENQTQVHPPIVDVGDSDGGIVRVIRPIIL